MQRSRDASWRTSPLHGRIPADAVHCDLAENPGIRVAQVTAGTRCYTATQDDTRSALVNADTSSSESRIATSASYIDSCRSFAPPLAARARAEAARARQNTSSARHLLA